VELLNPRWQIAPCSESAAEALASELGVKRTTAEVLIRRGYADAESARAFLEQDGPRHDPLLLGAMAAACARIEEAIAAGERICVHGDYDVDGICATALAVTVLRELGCDVVWHLPSRFEEGYGIGSQALERVAADGAALLLTVDCGITAVAEVARARELGLDVIVTDHHRPAAELPDCTIVATRPSDYPFPELCGTGVVMKLAEALWQRAGRPAEELDRHLDLVALATVADVVPLLDENRRLVRAGLRRMARTEKPGLRALMVASRVDRARVSAADLGFRLGPRINAAGRLGHPGAALELLLTTDAAEADRLADKLENLNRRRQNVEQEILDGAVELIEAHDEDWRSRRAYVLASSEWHEGVIGIVASRLVERYGRPVVLIAIGDEEAKGSGRSIPAYDLHGGLSACEEHLLRFGGHRAAAGLSIDPACCEQLADALAAHAASALADEDLQPRVRVDAVTAPSEVSLELVDELARLEPFGLGNPGVTLLAPGATLHALETMSEGRHLRGGVELGGFRCRAVGFGMGSWRDRLAEAGRVDVAYRLQRNEWNGAVALQMLLRAVAEVPELAAPAPPPSSPPAAALPLSPAIVDERGRGVQVATVARLIATGDDVLVVVADRERRRRMLRGVLAPERFCGGSVTLVEYAGLRDAAAGYAAVVALDPPADRDGERLLGELSDTMRVHLVWGAAEIEFARSVAEAREPLRPALAAVWRAGKKGDAPALPLETLESCLAVLAELGLDPARPAGSKVDLERSPTYRAALQRVRDVQEYLATVHPVGA
jgi:single-stranded-DNA-specific exonuclease